MTIGMIALLFVAMPAFAGQSASAKCAESELEALRELRTHIDHNQLLAESKKTGKVDEKKIAGQFLTVPNGPMKGRSFHYVDLDPTNGPAKGTVVALGGLGYHVGQWNEGKFVDVLRANNMHFVSLDLPGQGVTMVNDLAHGKATPLRYPAEQQGQLLLALLDHLKAQGRLNEPIYLIGESYGGWLAAFLSKNPEFAKRIKLVGLFDPGMGNTVHEAPLADMWANSAERAGNWVPGGKAVPQEMPGAGFYTATMGMSDQYIASMAQSPFFGVWGQAMQSSVDGYYKSIFEASFRQAYQTKGVLVTGMHGLFNGIREENMTAPHNSGGVLIPTVLFEAGNNGGIVPHSQHAAFAAGNPYMVGHYRLLGTEHDIPVDRGEQAARLFLDVIHGRRGPTPAGQRVDLDLDQEYPQNTGTH